MSVFDDDKKYIVNTYNRFPIAVIGGSGAIARDIDGREYIDFTSGIGVNSLGYCDHDWCDAVKKQTDLLNHTSNLYYTLPQIELARKLTQSTGYVRAFFCNSGAEANECAIKTARKYSFDKYGAGRNRIITLVNSFHGRTVTTLAATGQEVFHNYFFPFTEGFAYCPANDIDALKAMLTDDVCAVMFEFVQGEGGVNVLEKEFVRELFALCESKDIVTIADEVQTGIGRTGRLLASELYGVKPDITTLAKGLGGGLPIGAVLNGDKTAGTLGFSQHGTTFGGNPIVCAGACAVLDKITDDGFLDEVRKKGEYIRQAVKDCPAVDSLSGAGMMIGIGLKGLTTSEAVKRGIERSLLMLTAKDKVRLLPPLNIDEETLVKGTEILKQILS